MSIARIEKLETEQQAKDFAKFIKENKELKSVYDIEKFIKPIQELLGVVDMDIREVDTSPYHKQLECENIGFKFLLLKLENNKSILFKEFCYDDGEYNYIGEQVDFTDEQPLQSRFYKIETLLQSVYQAQEKLKEQQNILLCHID